MNPQENNTSPWREWAMELQSIAQCGLAYCKDVYDIERFERLREISAEMLAYQTEIPVFHIQSLFCSEKGYQTPKLDTRAAIFRDNKILLAQEKDGRWSLPGGWMDVTETVASNTIKEVYEETGLHARAERIIAIQDRNRHNPPPSAWAICKIFVLCSALGGEFRENSETLAADYFSLDSLPALSLEKTTREQIEMCFRANMDENWRVQFD